MRLMCRDDNGDDHEGDDHGDDHEGDHEDGHEDDHEEDHECDHEGELSRALLLYEYYLSMSSRFVCSNYVRI